MTDDRPTGADVLKAIRNTVLTVTALGLTVLAVNWNKEIVQNRDPLTIGQAALASQIEGVDGPLPLQVTIASPILRLGQSQIITIQTQPFTNLKIVTLYPNGSMNSTETFHATADELGRYTFRFKPNDFHDLGLFTVLITASLQNQSSTYTGHFTLSTWADAAVDNQPHYVFPLIP